MCNINGSENKKACHEIIHSKSIADKDPELIWGWKTAAGKRRAKRRAKMIADSARLVPESYVLEIGCGTGIFAGAGLNIAL